MKSENFYYLEFRYSGNFSFVPSPRKIWRGGVIGNIGGS